MNAQPEAANGSPPKILVLAFSAIGDAIVTIPLLAEARRQYPGCEIVVACQRAATARLFTDFRAADRVLCIGSRSRRSPVQLLLALRTLRKISPRILLQSFASHGSFGNLAAKASGAAVRCGFEAGRLRQFLSHRVPIRPSTHYISLNLDLLRRLGHWEVQDPTGAYLSELLKKPLPPKPAARTIVVSIGSDPRQPFKRWPIPHWVQLARLLSESGYHLLFIGDGTEAAQCEAITSAPAVSATNLAGRTDFMQLAETIRAAEYVLGTDGMVHHLAAGLGKRCAALFGPTDEAWCGPWGEGHLIIRVPLPCSPCLHSGRVGSKLDCKTYECLSHMSPRFVFERLSNFK